MRPFELYRRSDAAPIEPLIGREESAIRHQEHAAAGSRMLRDATLSLFRKWERRHGFREGAGCILVPAGYQPTKLPDYPQLSGASDKFSSFYEKVGGA